MCTTEPKNWPEGVQRVAAALQAQGHAHMPQMLDAAARTAQQAADALGILVGQVAKSIIFRCKSDDAAVLVVTSGDRRVDERKLQAHVGRVGRADAEFVKARTGFSIGGVAPLAHATPPVTLIDQDLLRFAVVWAAAGHPHSVFALHRGDLQRLTGAPVVDVVQDPAVPLKAIELLALRARQACAGDHPDPASAEAVPSPCISVCRMSAEHGHCEGCFRTPDEIGIWSRADAHLRRSIWKQLLERAGIPPAAPQTMR